MKQLKEEKELRFYIDTPDSFCSEAEERVWLKGLHKCIRAFEKAVREDEMNQSAERGFAEYLRMFGDSHQNVMRAGKIAAAIRGKK